MHRSFLTQRRIAALLASAIACGTFVSGSPTEAEGWAGLAAEAASGSPAGAAAPAGDASGSLIGGDFAPVGPPAAPPEASLFELRPLTLPLAALFAQDDFGQAYGGHYLPPLRFDVLLGAIVPFEESGMAFGAATSDEDFDPGAMFGFRLQVGLDENFYVGGEIDFAAHDVGQGDVFFPGDLGRIYLMAPFSFIGHVGEGELVEIGLSIAPGLQIALPDVDRDFEDLQLFLGRFIDEDDFVAFTLRAAARISFPIDWGLRFFFEGSYDWAYGEAEVEVRNAFGQLIERRRDEVDLSALNLFAGFSVTF